MRTPQLHHALPVLTAVLLGAVVVLGGHRAAPPIAVAAQDDFAGLINIDNGRQLYLECRGAGSPTVVLEAGYRSSARAWSEDFRQLGAPRMMVFAGVAGFTRVCAYDRPGTVAPLKDDVRPSRSDPVPQPGPPRTPLPTSTDCFTPQASPVPTFWLATRWADSSSGSTPAYTPVRSSGSSSLTPIPSGLRR